MRNNKTLLNIDLRTKNILDLIKVFKSSYNLINKTIHERLSGSRGVSQAEGKLFTDR